MRIGKILFSGGLVIILFIAGLLLLIRGCLSKYDERYAMAPVLYFEKGHQQVLFSLVQDEEATSYSSRGGMVSKSVNTTYVIQQNDAVSGAKLKEESVKKHGDIKNYPIEIMGASDGLAWVFMGEPMAFDPFTLEKKADIAELEKKNPGLAGRFPEERRFYRFNTADRQLYFTANDGTKWKLNTTTLLAAASEDDPDKSPLENLLKAIEQQQQLNRAAQDTLYKSYPGRLYSQGKISQQEYSRRQQLYEQQQKALYQQRDSLQAIYSSLRDQQSAERQLQSAMEGLRRLKPSYTQLKTNQDTVAGKWFGLYGTGEWDELYERVQHQTAYDETARRQFYVGSYGPSRNGMLVVDKANAVTPASASYFLHGGFLLDKRTALPIRLSAPAGYLVVYKDKVGSKGNTLLSRMDEQGKVLWTFNTTLPDWVDWLYAGNKLFILGVDNPELSSDQSNLLWSINLTDGRATRYDYFSDK